MFVILVFNKKFDPKMYSGQNFLYVLKEVINLKHNYSLLKVTIISDFN